MINITFDNTSTDGHKRDVFGEKIIVRRTIPMYVPPPPPLRWPLAAPDTYTYTSALAQEWAKQLLLARCEAAGHSAWRRWDQV